MPAKLIDNNTEIEKPIKNLGWLLKNWYTVEALEVTREIDSINPPNDCTLKAYCLNGKVYICDFASYPICIEFLDRPVFKGKSVKIIQQNGEQKTFIVGDAEYKVMIAKFS